NMKLLYILLSCVLLLGVSQTRAAEPAPLRRDVRAPKRVPYPYKRFVLLPDGRSLRELEGYDWDE
ncbi:hypothetical protein BgiBS90_019265, partial [Biomphalaria glabrata]